ncbi:MAG: RNA methyltransferase [Acidimicrobiaceae bacterium]|nr:RNA methyltransferase [Acidimicrobiaceae bacterium]
MQRVRRLLARRSARLAEGAFVVEGAKLLTEALDAGAAVESVYLDPSAGPVPEPLVARCLDAGLRVYDLEPGVLVRVADAVTPQPILGVVSMVDLTLEEALAAAGAPSAGPGALVVTLVELRDPGNAGSVLRSADAAGVDAVVFAAGSVDLYNPKTVRASAGALFHVPVAVGPSPEDVLRALGEAGLRRLATVARGGEDYSAVDLGGPTALVLGNEANGLPATLDPFLDGAITIPMAGRAESLNVGMAAAVLCFEAARQRRLIASMAAPPT